MKSLKGFTLIELLIVLAIIAIVYGAVADGTRQTYPDTIDYTEEQAVVEYVETVLGAKSSGVSCHININTIPRNTIVVCDVGIGGVSIVKASYHRDNKRIIID